MRDHYHGQPFFFIKPFDQVMKSFLALDVHAGCRFVKKEYPWIIHNRLCDHYSLELPSGETAYVSMCQVSGANNFEKLVNMFLISLPFIKLKRVDRG